MEMNVHVTGVILLNDTQITHILNFHPHFRETVILGIFCQIDNEMCSFFVVEYNKS